MVYPLNITFIFAVKAVKYECDSLEKTSTFAKFSVTENLVDRNLATPTQELTRHPSH